MRIALFAETFQPGIDGTSNTLCHLPEHLEARGDARLLFALAQRQFPGLLAAVRSPETRCVRASCD